MNKPKLFIACDTTNIIKVKKIINLSKTNKIKIGFISEFFTDHTIGKLFKNLIFSLDLKFFDIVIYHSNKTKKGEIFEEFLNENKKGFKNEILPFKLIDKIKIIEKEKIIAEKLNGRFAMIGFIALVGAYLTTGQIIPGFI